MERCCFVMKKSTRKTIVGVALGIVFVGGSLGSLVHAQHYDHGRHDGGLPHMGGHGKDMAHQNIQMSPDELAGHVSETFGVSKAEVQEAMKGRADFFDIGQAAMLAKISGKSFRDVMAMKTKTMDWPEIAQSLGVTEEAIQKELDEMEIMHITMQGNVDADTARRLIQNGYEMHDINMAGIIAKASGKDIQSVLDRKQINNRWEDVADVFGVDRSLLKPQHQSIRPMRSQTEEN